MDKEMAYLEKIKLIMSKRNEVLYKEILPFQSINILSETQKKKIVDEIQNEFCEAGLRSDDEPNEYGLLIEDMLDFLSEKK